METTDILFALLRHAVCGEELKVETINACTPENLESVYKLAKKHDLAHLVAHAVEGMDIPECEVLNKLKNAKMRAIYRYARIDYEYERICQTLETARIPFIPLKGSVLRQYYPEPWMRNSCDIDVLVAPFNLEKAEETLTQMLHYSRKGSCAHDVSLYSPSGVHVELHFTTIEDHVSQAAQVVLDWVWERAKPKAPTSSHYVMQDELFYFYHIAHMAKHVISGGCGIRTFLDIWIMENRMPENYAVRKKLLKQGGLWKFADVAEKLMRFWFSDGAPDEDVYNLERYILVGGTYGVLTNKVMLSQARTGGKLKNFLKRVFMPYALMKIRYPVLEEYPWMMPFFHVRRWFETLTGDRMRVSVKELMVNQNSSKEEQQEAEALLHSIGLYRGKDEV